MAESKRDFAADQRLCDKATAGPWIATDPPDDEYVLDADYMIVASSECSADTVFIAQSREGWPAALAEIARLQETYDGGFEELHCLQADIDCMKSAIGQLYKAFSRGKQVHGPIHRCLMAAGGLGILTEVSEDVDGEETAEADVGPEGAD